MDFLEFSDKLQPYDSVEEHNLQVALDKLAVELESTFSNRGLQFTVNFYGAMPMQAMGWLDGERFYFRFRRDTATLQRGNVDPVIARGEYEKYTQRFPAYDGVPMTNEHPRAYPHLVTARAEIKNVSGEPLLGILEPCELRDIFVRLIQML